MGNRSIGRTAMWRMRIVVSAILLLAPTLLVACALQDPLVGTADVWESEIAEVHANAEIVAASPFEYAFFGGAVAVSGETAVIGAWGDADRGRNTGAAYVFGREGDVWTQRARLSAEDAAAGARFGHAVAIDRELILVGSIYHDGAGPRAGAVYVFELTDGTWRQTDRLSPRDASADAHFGSSVDLDGRTALIGASGPSAGAAYVFHASDAGWTEQARLAPVTASLDSRFGTSVALEGDTAVVGAPSTQSSGFDSEPSDTLASSVHVFERRNGQWGEPAVLTAGGDDFDGAFGQSVAVGDGVVAVGAPGDREAVFVYGRSESTWRLRSVLRRPSDRVEHFGISVAVHGDTLLVGAPGSNDRAGAAYIFEDDGSAWIGVAKVMAADPGTNLHLGGSVALDQDVVLIGATGARAAGVATGAVFAVH